MQQIFKIIFFSTIFVVTFACKKLPPKTLNYGRKQSGDNGYRLVVGSKENEGYEPGKIYNLFLVGSRNYLHLQHFTHFMITAEAYNIGTSRSSIAGPKRVGRFQLFGDSLTKFYEMCVNTVSEADDLPKTEVQTMWVAPAKGSGCVRLSAMIYEGKDAWYAEAGGLSKIICEQEPDKTKKALTEDECCACDEAKYNFVFEGIWSNETHPKDYPFAVWLTHFSDIVGASHDANFSFWGENHIATDGFRSLAEWGSPRALEEELRAKGGRLRTLIKAGGLWYPNVNANTSSHFKVDRKHNKLSLVSMFGPSPDWVVGVNGLNLCKKDCSWEVSLDIDLYPWDSGTDSGISYMSPNAETQPRERMHKITTKYPEDPRAPFYNIHSDKMVPLAKLFIRREKVVTRNCDDEVLQSQILDVSENDDNENNNIPECEVTDFSAWSPCSVTCGKGLRERTRSYRRPQKATEKGCSRQLVFKEMCVAVIAECDNEGDDDSSENLALSEATVNEQGEGLGICKTTRWSDWSECSATCGVGITMRTRTFLDRVGRKKCPHITVVEKQKCMQPECSIADLEIPDPNCPMTPWSDWSPCSVTCGKGVQIRTRLLLVEPSKEAACKVKKELNQQRQCSTRQDCVFDYETARQICSLEPDVGSCRGAYRRFYYDPLRQSCQEFEYGGCRGNQNNFLTNDVCMSSCSLVRATVPASRGALRNPQQPITTAPREQSQIDNRRFTTAHTQNLPVDCVLSEWSEWSACSVACGIGFSEKTRRTLTEPKNGGLECAKLVKRRRCNGTSCT
ncbi:CLUMA_CG003720, isoform A [Clunio marinus]|uniref:Spondin-1 n=1 Tax=Clunio marinus TaxID=568069 RepID=A0A1J1HR27_9DIPT|nr:CLUMA_CG003720, isoform A [Clunio marinus]